MGGKLIRFSGNTCAFAKNAAETYALSYTVIISYHPIILRDNMGGVSSLPPIDSFYTVDSKHGIFIK